MPREPEPSQNDKAFVLKLLEDGRRLDGRGFSEYRKLDLTFGDELGVADVQLGKTRQGFKSKWE
jgi:exosome complex component RRP45